MKRSTRISTNAFLPRITGFLSAAVLALLLAGCGFSLAEDIKPPANYKEPVEVTVTATEQSPAAADFPLVPPDPAQGKAIYAEKCAPCHGETGMGDGVQAANLANPVAPLGRPDLARSARPADWYRMVTEGNLEKFMPGFASLSDRQRWDVVAYALTLSTTPAELEEGKALYAETCASCHGITGAGDGEQAASQPMKPAAWQDHERLVSLSAASIVEVMAGAKEGHPAVETQMDEAQQYAVAAYIRSLTFASESAASGEVSTQPDSSSSSEAAAAVPDFITITGKVTNASSGVLPAGMQVTITAYAGMAPAFDVSSAVKEDGTYAVNDVEYAADYVYFAQVEADGQIFNSDILHGSDITGDTAILPLTIYDSTSDISNIRAERLHIFFDFTQPGKVQVVNLYIISNLGNQVVVPAQPDQALLEFNLPEGAENLQFQEGELGGRYLQTSSGFGDRMSIVPGVGQHQVLFAYDLPYDRKLALDVKVSLPVDAVTVMVPPGGVKVKSGQLTDVGQRDVQGMSFQMYQSNATLEAGQDLALSLSGRASGSGIVANSGSLSTLLIGIGGFALALIGGGWWLLRSRREPVLEEAEEETQPSPAVEETSESLLDAIVALDDLHAAGNLPEAAYQERRADLKARLVEALKNEK